MSSFVEREIFAKHFKYTQPLLSLERSQVLYGAIVDCRQPVNPPPIGDVIYAEVYHLHGQKFPAGRCSAFAERRTTQAGWHGNDLSNQRVPMQSRVPFKRQARSFSRSTSFYSFAADQSSYMWSDSAQLIVVVISIRRALVK